MMHVRATAIAAAILALSGAEAGAQNSADTFAATMRVTGGCSVHAADLVFPQAATLTGTETTTSQITVICTTGVAWSLAMRPIGNSPNANGIMSGVTPGNPDTISYRMTLQNPRSGTGTGAAQTVTLRGQITTAGTPRSDNYLEARTVYMSF